MGTIHFNKETNTLTISPEGKDRSSSPSYKYTALPLASNTSFVHSPEDSPTSELFSMASPATDGTPATACGIIEAGKVVDCDIYAVRNFVEALAQNGLTVYCSIPEETETVHVGGRRARRIENSSTRSTTPNPSTPSSELSDQSTETFSVSSASIKTIDYVIAIENRTLAQYLEKSLRESDSSRLLDDLSTFFVEFYLKGHRLVTDLNQLFLIEHDNGFLKIVPAITTPIPVKEGTAIKENVDEFVSRLVAKGVFTQEKLVEHFTEAVTKAIKRDFAEKFDFLLSELLEKNPLVLNNSLETLQICLFDSFKSGLGYYPEYLMPTAVTVFTEEHNQCIEKYRTLNTTIKMNIEKKLAGVTVTAADLFLNYNDTDLQNDFLLGIPQLPAVNSTALARFHLHQLCKEKRETKRHEAQALVEFFLANPPDNQLTHFMSDEKQAIGRSIAIARAHIVSNIVKQTKILITALKTLLATDERIALPNKEIYIDNILETLEDIAHDDTFATSAGHVLPEVNTVLLALAHLETTNRQIKGAISTSTYQLIEKLKQFDKLNGLSKDKTHADRMVEVWKKQRPTYFARIYAQKYSTNPSHELTKEEFSLWDISLIAEEKVAFKTKETAKKAAAKAILQFPDMEKNPLLATAYRLLFNEIPLSLVEDDPTVPAWLPFFCRVDKADFKDTLLLLLEFVQGMPRPPKETWFGYFSSLIYGTDHVRVHLWMQETLIKLIKNFDTEDPRVTALKLINAINTYAGDVRAFWDADDGKESRERLEALLSNPKQQLANQKEKRGEEGTLQEAWVRRTALLNSQEALLISSEKEESAPLFRPYAIEKDQFLQKPYDFLFRPTSFSKEPSKLKTWVKYLCEVPDVDLPNVIESLLDFVEAMPHPKPENRTVWFGFWTSPRSADLTAYRQVHNEMQQTLKKILNRTKSENPKLTLDPESKSMPHDHSKAALSEDPRILKLALIRAIQHYSLQIDALPNGDFKTMSCQKLDRFSQNPAKALSKPKTAREQLAQEARLLD